MKGVLCRTGCGFIWVLPTLLGHEGFSQAQDQKAGRWFQKPDSCYEANGGCEALFQESVQAISLIESDALAAKRFLGLATLREAKGGHWDSPMDDLHFRALARLPAHGDPCLTLSAHYRLIRFALFSDQPDTRVVRALKGVNVAQLCGDSSEIAHAYSFLSAAYTRKGLYKKALEKLFDSERIYSNLGDFEGMAMVNLDLSEKYDLLGRNTELMSEI